jgi:uncharacterized membrane protein
VLPVAAKKNVKTIAQVEQQLLGRHSRAESMAGGVARFFGSFWFIAAHGLFLTGWVLVNTGLLPIVQPFDLYPFPFLSFIIGVEFILLTTFVLMNQNLQARRQEHWAHLNLQLSMLAEHEVTKNLQLLHRICEHLGLETSAGDREVKDLAQATPVTTLVAEIEKAREVDGPAGQ